jgi:hypothetical protein
VPQQEWYSYGRVVCIDLALGGGRQGAEEVEGQDRIYVYQMQVSKYPELYTGADSQVHKWTSCHRF